GLAAAGRPGDEQHAVRFMAEPAKALYVGSVEAQRVERKRLMRRLVERLLVEHAQHRVLAVDAGHDGDAEIHRAAALERLEAPVLRHPPLGDVELGEHFYARDRLL